MIGPPLVGNETRLQHGRCNNELQGRPVSICRGRLVALEDNKDVVRVAFGPIEAVLAMHDQLYGPDWVGRFPGMPPLDANGHRAYSEAMQTAFPDLDRRVEDLVAEGDKVVARWSARGTNTGAFNGMPPTGKVAESSGITIFRLQDGRIVEEWSESDMLGLLTQLGAISFGSAPG
jgi:steroid delta-isomerase-like uncharacterized protein